ncbi:hypothetical protein ACIQ9Q_33735 [Streptomyces sp. NPDC094438]|uniref:hypothetical protein n=1 Tax=Streptomyces sp. NPDC094438 TaxID=3366061 RepID=UPI003814F426
MPGQGAHGGQDHDVRLGVRVSSRKNRRDKLNGDQLALLAGLGMGRAREAG